MVGKLKWLDRSTTRDPKGIHSSGRCHAVGRKPSKSNPSFSKCFGTDFHESEVVLDQSGKEYILRRLEYIWENQYISEFLKKKLHSTRFPFQNFAYKLISDLDSAIAHSVENSGTSDKAICFELINKNFNFIACEHQKNLNLDTDEFMNPQKTKQSETSNNTPQLESVSNLAALQSQLQGSSLASPFAMALQELLANGGAGAGTNGSESAQQQQSKLLEDLLKVQASEQLQRQLLGSLAFSSLTGPLANPFSRLQLLSYLQSMSPISRVRKLTCLICH